MVKSVIPMGLLCRYANKRVIEPWIAHLSPGSLEQVVKEEMPLIHLYFKLWWPFCSVEQMVCAMLVESIMRNISMKLYSIWTSDSGGDII